MITGDARQKLCKLLESLTCYDAVLELNSTDIIALKGQADVNLALAYQFYSLGSLGQMSQAIAKGIQSVDKILNQNSSEKLNNLDKKNLVQSGIINQESSSSSEKSRNSELRSVWKLRGDLCTLARNLAPADAAFLIQLSQIVPRNVSGNLPNYVPGNILKNVPWNVPGNYDAVVFSGLGTGGSLPSYLPLLRILKEGEQAYRRVLEIAEDSGSADSACYLDIGCAVFYQAAVGLHASGQGSGVYVSSTEPSDPVSDELFLQCQSIFTAGMLSFRLFHTCDYIIMTKMLMIVLKLFVKYRSFLETLYFIFSIQLTCLSSSRLFLHISPLPSFRHPSLSLSLPPFLSFRPSLIRLI